VAAVFGETISVVSGGLACVLGTVLLLPAFPAFLRYDARNPIP
jgi:hypothetical protein